MEQSLKNNPQNPLIQLRKDPFSCKQARFDHQSRFSQIVFSLKKQTFFCVFLVTYTTLVFECPPWPIANPSSTSMHPHSSDIFKYCLHSTNSQRVEFTTSSLFYTEDSKTFREQTKASLQVKKKTWNCTHSFAFPHQRCSEEENQSRSINSWAVSVCKHALTPDHGLDKV